MVYSLHLLITIVLFLWLFILWKRRKFYKLIFKIPGPIGYPLIGCTLSLLKREEILKSFEKFEQTYGKLLYGWLGPHPFILVTDPQIVQDIYTSPDCINKSHLYMSATDAVGEGLPVLNNPKWSEHRKLLNPAFNIKILLSFMSTFNKEANILLDLFDSFTMEKNDVDIFPVIQEFALNISIQTTMDKNISDKKNLQNTNVTSAYQLLLPDITEILFYPWLSYKIIRQMCGREKSYAQHKNTIREFIQNLIDEKLKSDTKVAESNKNVFINIALELWRNGHFTLKDVLGESNIVVFAGFETTAATVTHTLIMLAMFPEYQQRAYEEIVAILPERGECEISYSEIQQMVYLDMVINETMRLIAPVPVVLRETSAEVTLSNGIVLPEGLQVAIDIFNMQRNKDIWGPDAKNYNPDKFLPYNLEQIHPFAFVPFTKGLRSCIGKKYAYMSMKVTLAKLIRNYHFSTKFKFHNLEFVEDASIKLKEKPLLQISKRDH